jgi:hypothetical protein
MGGGDFFRWIALALVAACVVHFIKVSNEPYKRKNFAFGSGGDMIMTYVLDSYPHAMVAQEALHWIEANMPADADFAVLPEGVMLNYLSRRPNPTPYIVFMKIEMIAFGEYHMFKALVEAEPDYIVLVHKDTGQYGVGYFGADPGYGREVMEWIDENYKRAALFGSEPLKDKNFGIKILERRK